MNGGASYRVLLRDIYPALRHSDYAVRYTIRSFTVEEARELIYSDPRQLSLNEMFRVAQTMEPGSDAYREVFEIAVRMYPEDPVSNLTPPLRRSTRVAWNRPAVIWRRLPIPRSYLGGGGHRHAGEPLGRGGGPAG